MDGWTDYRKNKLMDVFVCAVVHVFMRESDSIYIIVYVYVSEYIHDVT